MTDHMWGYRQGKKMAREAAGSGKIAVKGHVRGGPIRKQARPRMPLPPQPQQPAPMMPPASAPMGPPSGMKKGGPVRKGFPKSPPSPKPTSKDSPILVKAAKGGPININPANKGKLRASLGAKSGEKIPAAKIAKAANSSDPVLKKRAVFAQNAARWKKG